MVLEYADDEKVRRKGSGVGLLGCTRLRGVGYTFALTAPSKNVGVMKYCFVFCYFSRIPFGLNARTARTRTFALKCGTRVRTPLTQHRYWEVELVFRFLWEWLRGSDATEAVGIELELHYPSLNLVGVPTLVC